MPMPVPPSPPLDRNGHRGPSRRDATRAGSLTGVGEVTGWFVTCAGAFLVLAALRDIFHTLWHPSGPSGLGRKMLATVWRAGRPRRERHRVSVLAGPLSMVLVVMAWVVLVVLGWTLVYWPHLDDGFSSAGLQQTS